VLRAKKRQQRPKKFQYLLTAEQRKLIVSRDLAAECLRQADGPPAQGREACPGSSEPLSARAAAFLGSRFVSTPGMGLKD